MKKRPIPISTLKVPWPSGPPLVPANWDMSGMVGMMSFFSSLFGGPAGGRCLENIHRSDSDDRQTSGDPGRENVARDVDGMGLV